MSLPLLTPVTPHELGEVAAFVNAAYRGESARAGWAHEADLLGGQRTDAATLAADLAATPGATLLAWREEEGALRGSVWLEPAGGDAWYLGMLTVDPGAQASGHGRALLAAAEAYAAAHGARRIIMTVIEARTSLIAWYQRRGYALTGERKPFPYGDARFGEPLTDHLAFVVLDKRLGA